MHAGKLSATKLRPTSIVLWCCNRFSAQCFRADSGRDCRLQLAWTCEFWTLVPSTRLLCMWALCMTALRNITPAALTPQLGAVQAGMHAVLALQGPLLSAENLQCVCRACTTAFTQMRT